MVVIIHNKNNNKKNICLLFYQLGNGEKAAVNSPIALLAEEGDEISNVEMPAAEEDSGITAATTSEEPKRKCV